MALFKSKKNKEVKKAEAPAADISAVSMKSDLAHVLRHARITEKATVAAESGVYIFSVTESASKRDITAAVRKLYSVTPIKVRVSTVPSKTRRSMRTGKIGVKKGGKKAYVYLKKGDTI